MNIHTFPLGPLYTNCYLLINDTEALVIDPGGTSPTELNPVTSILQEKKLNLLGILCTHLHYDHISNVETLQKITQAPIFASSHDAFLFNTIVGQGGLYGYPKITPFKYTHLEEGPYTLSTMPFIVLNTPGHSLGSLCFYFEYEKLIFTGDLLFYQSVGRTDLPGGNSLELSLSLKNKISPLPKYTTIYPGHGRSASIEEALNNNPYITL